MRACELSVKWRLESRDGERKGIGICGLPEELGLREPQKGTKRLGEESGRGAKGP